MDITRVTRNELNELCKEIFGVPSKWRKVLEKGTSELMTRTIKENVPGENGAPDTVKEVLVPILTDYGAKQKYRKYYTVDELLNLLRDLKAQKIAFLAKQKSDQERKELEKKIHEQANGSVL